MARVQDRPPVFILLGTTPLNDRPDFFRMCLAAFAGTNWQEAMAIGDRMKSPNWPLRILEQALEEHGLARK